jgi:hypothetical protein
MGPHGIFVILTGNKEMSVMLRDCWVSERKATTGIKISLIHHLYEPMLQCGFDILSLLYSNVIDV